MKKSFNAAILAATLAIAFIACSNPAAPENPSSSSSANENRGTAPVLTQAFISETTNISSADFNWNNLVQHTTHDMYYYPEGTANSARNHFYYLCIDCTDPDRDVNTIEISYDGITYHTFYNQCDQGGYTSVYMPYGIAFDANDLNKSKYYIRLKDAKNNVSNVKEYNISVQADPNFNYPTE